MTKEGDSHTIQPLLSDERIDMLGDYYSHGGHGRRFMEFMKVDFNNGLRDAREIYEADRKQTAARLKAQELVIQDLHDQLCGKTGFETVPKQAYDDAMAVIEKAKEALEETNGLLHRHFGDCNQWHNNHAALALINSLNK